MPEQIMWSADSWKRTNDTYTIQGLTIEGGNLLVEAEEAVTKSLEFDSRWELTGAVKMSVGSARLMADSAVFEFESGELVSAELSGDPATFEETEPAQTGPIRGEAEKIVFDRAAGTVQMQGGATFTMAQNRMSGCDFLYELDGGLVSGSSECGVDLTIIYVPPGRGSGAGETPKDGDEPQTSVPEESPPTP